MYELRDRYGHDVLHAGMQPVGSETLRMLCAWAEIIIISNVADLNREKCRESARVLNDYMSKVYSIEIGEDRWRDPMNKELRKIICGKIKEHHELIVSSLIP